MALLTIFSTNFVHPHRWPQFGKRWSVSKRRPATALARVVRVFVGRNKCDTFSAINDAPETAVRPMSRYRVYYHVSDVPRTDNNRGAAAVLSANVVTSLRSNPISTWISPHVYHNPRRMYFHLTLGSRFVSTLRIYNTDIFFESRLKYDFLFLIFYISTFRVNTFYLFNLRYLLKLNYQSFSDLTD